MKNKNLIFSILTSFLLVFTSCKEDGNLEDKKEDNKEFSVNFSAVFEDNEAIPHIGIWYLNGTEEYVEEWKEASTDLAFGGASNTDQNGVKEQRYLKPNYKANLSKKTGKEDILLAKSDAKYIYIILEPRDGEDFIELRVNGVTVDDVDMKGFQSNRLKIEITEDVKIQLVCKKDTSSEVVVEPAGKEIKMQFIAFYTDKDGEKVNPEASDVNNRFKGTFEIGKTYLENDKIKEFITYKFKEGKNTGEERELTGNFKVKDKVGYTYSDKEFTSLNDFKVSKLGSSKSVDLIVFFEYKFSPKVVVKEYDVAFADWNWEISFEADDISETTKIGDVSGALDKINEIEALTSFSHWEYLINKKTFEKAKIKKGALKDKLVKDVVNAYGSVSLTAAKK